MILLLQHLLAGIVFMSVLIREQTEPPKMSINLVKESCLSYIFVTCYDYQKITIKKKPSGEFYQ
jgi:hypothetical protein